MSTLPRLVHLGDAQHGVDRYAREVAAHVARTHPDVRLVLPQDLEPGAHAHVHFTDRLWGASPAEAATAIERLAATATISVTLHDVPQASDGDASMRRRADAYGRVARAASLVVCSSEHERALLHASVDVPRGVAVVPLASAAPDEHALAPVPAHALRREIGVLGFVYPGKGHREAIEASASLPDPLPVVAIGRAAPGHEEDLAALVRDGARLGVPVSSTGFLTDDELLARMRETLVPVVAHRHVSASGSLTTWVRAGRRPLVVRNPYFEEMAALRPGTTRLVTDAGLASAIADAAADPSRTRLAPDARTRPDADDVAAAYLDLWLRS